MKEEDKATVCATCRDKTECRWTTKAFEPDSLLKLDEVRGNNARYFKDKQDNPATVITPALEEKIHGAIEAYRKDYEAFKTKCRIGHMTIEPVAVENGA
jgi:hypothetical protein